MNIRFITVILATLFCIAIVESYSYSSLGCWRDKGKANSSKRPRALDSLEGTSDLLDGKFRKRKNATEKCAELANSLNLEIFAVSRGGECLGSFSANANFKKYGEGRKCNEGKGGNEPRSMDVYALETEPLPTPPLPTPPEPHQPTCVDGIQNQGESGVDCGGPCWSCDPPINGVSCGGHSAPTCAECPQGNGAAWCNGQCGWDYTESVCFKPESEIFCRNDNDCIITESCELESEQPRSDATDFIKKFTNEKRNSILKQASEDYFKLKLLSDRSTTSPGRWAESVHLDFSRDGFDRWKWSEVSKNGWMLENTIIVHKSVRTTFFETIGYGGGYAGIQQQPSHVCGMTEGFCGNFIFSLWDKNGNDASIVRAGENVYTNDFGGEGTGVKSMKLANWRPNEEVVTTVKGTWDAGIHGYRVECTFKIGQTEHFMAEFQRSGEYGMHDDFVFNSFIEDWNHQQNAEGCLYQRSAAFITPKIYYNEAGKQKVVELDTARFTGDTNPGQSFCKDWSCADSGINFFTMTTGGARQGKPDQECYNGQMFTFNAENDPNLKGPVKHCV